MTDLTSSNAGLSPAARSAELLQLQQTARSARAASTRVAYESDVRWFTAWCQRRGDVALPADPVTVAVYLDQAARTLTTDGTFAYAPATLARWVASINDAHRRAGEPEPGASTEVRDTLRGIRRIRRQPQHRKRPLLLDDLRAVLADLADVTTWPAAVAARRDAAVLLFGFAGAFRRSEVASLDDRDVVLHPYDGLHITLRQSKTDQAAEGTVKALPYGEHPLTCPPCAWIRWRAAVTAGTRAALMAEVLHAPDGHICRSTTPPTTIGTPAFLSVDRHGTIKPARMSGHAINEMVKRRAAVLGVDLAQMGGHSMRAGFVTQGFRSGADAHAIMRQTGQKSFATLERYAREAAPLIGNAVTRIGL